MPAIRVFVYNATVVATWSSHDAAISMDYLISQARVEKEMHMLFNSVSTFRVSSRCR